MKVVTLDRRCLCQIVAKHPMWLLSATEATDRESSQLFTPYGESYYTWIEAETYVMVCEMR